METDLEKIINSPTTPLGPAEVRCFMRQMLECVVYLHGKGILHRVPYGGLMLCI